MTLNDLKQRKIINNITSEEKLQNAINSQASIYCGFDPTATSLHLGNFTQIIALLLFQKAGLKPICVLGTGTGMIGDPSGKKSERVLLSKETLLKNAEGIAKQLSELTQGKAITVKNSDWLEKVSFLEFLRDVGKHINVSYMINKEQVNKRIETGISYTEFSYMLLQSWDFYQLYKNYSCWVQMGGSDQWGNITSGVELIRKIEGDENNKSCGVTFNLLTKENGEKFGKSESGVVSLNKEITSPYSLLQFLLNQPDSQVEQLLFALTLISNEEILKIMSDHKVTPHLRVAQKSLANWVVEYIHGKKELDLAWKISEYLFKTKVSSLTEDQLSDLHNNIQKFHASNETSLISEVFILNNIFTSKREFQEFLKNKSIKINGEILQKDLNFENINKLFKKYIFVSKGKKEFFIFKE